MCLNMIKMKKTIIVFILLAVFMFPLGCEKKQTDNKSRIYSVSSLLDKGDGWYYQFMLSREENGNILNYAFNGSNLRHTDIPGYSFKHYDAETGEILKKLETEMAFLTDDDIRGAEVLAINNFFEEKHFNDHITLEDLSDLEIEYFDKEDLVYLFNNALDEEFSRSQGQDDLTGIYKSNDNGKGYWQIGTLSDYGYIKAVNIDYIDNNKGSLVDRVEKGTIKDKNIYNKIKEIEEYILNNDMEKTYEYYKDLPEEYKQLLDLIKNCNNI